jgi:hypothetical protein
MNGARSSLRPQDILIALKLRILEDSGNWNQQQLAQSIGVSAGEVAFSLERLKKHHLIQEDKKRVKRVALIEFLVHGVKYVFPADVGAPVRGVPTGTNFALSDEIRMSEERVTVWPDADGKVRGLSISPIYSSVPFACKDDKNLHNILALLDVIRIGGAREMNLASKKIEDEILNGKFKN